MRVKVERKVGTKGAGATSGMSQKSPGGTADQPRKTCAPMPLTPNGCVLLCAGTDSISDVCQFEGLSPER